MRRHATIASRMSQVLGSDRASVTEENIRSWFKTLSTYLGENTDVKALLNDPRRHFNCDESGFPLQTSSGRVLAPKGSKHVYRISNPDKTQLTVMCGFNAMGEYPSPLIIFPGQRLRDLSLGDFADALYGVSETGWMTSELFLSYLQHLSAFASAKQIARPIVVYVDGHSTHITLQAAEYCSSQQIILYCLPAHSTHILQPCDVSFFGPMKSTWNSEAKQRLMDHLGQNLTKKNFPLVFKKAYERVAKPETAVGGFRRCGLFPLDPKNLDFSKLQPSTPIQPTPTNGRVSTDDHPDRDFNAVAASSTMPVEPTVIPSNSVTVEARLPHTSPTVDSAATTIDNCETAPCPSLLPSPVALPNMPIPQSAATQAETPLELYTDPSLGVTSGSEHVSIPVGTRSTTLAFSSQDSARMVSPGFMSLPVPELKTRKQPTNNLREKIPKAVSGVKALAMFREREAKKREEEEAKKKRKEDREANRLRKERENIEKAKKREERKLEMMKRREQKQSKTKATKKSLKRRKEEEEAESDTDSLSSGGIQYADSSEDDVAIEASCPACGTSENGEDMVSCDLCDRWYHKGCTGISAIDNAANAEELECIEFVCKICTR